LFFDSKVIHIFLDKKHTPMPADSAPRYLHNFATRGILQDVNVYISLLDILSHTRPS